MIERLGGKLPFLDEFAATSGLKWEITVRDVFVPSPHISSFPIEERHELLIPLALVSNLDQRQEKGLEAGLAHEVGHAWIAENIDPILSTTAVDTNREDPDYRRKIKIVETITDFINVWATDIVVEVLERRDLVGEQIRLWLSGSKRLRRLDADKFALEYATHVGLASHHGFTTMTSRLNRLAFESQRVIGRQQVGIMDELAEVCRELPIITQVADRAIEIYEETAGRYAEIFGIDLPPQLISYEGYYIWTF